jgi:hypothetical protein
MKLDKLTSQLDECQSGLTVVFVATLAEAPAPAPEAVQRNATSKSSTWNMRAW